MMFTETFPSPSIAIEGAVDLRAEPTGLRPSRLPRWALAQVPDAFFKLVVDAATGIRLRTRTQARIIELTVATMHVEVPGTGELKPVFDLRIGGRLHERQIVDGGTRLVLTGGGLQTIPAGPSTVRFDGLPEGEKELELWLPHAAACDLISLSSDRELQAPTPSRAPRWVHYGSSVSQSANADGPTSTWAAICADTAGFALTSLGYSGNAMLDPFVARTIRDLPTDLVSLEVGANIVEQSTMTERVFAPALDGFLDTIREGHPATPLIVASSLACPRWEETGGDGTAHGLTLRRVREIVERVVTRRTIAGDTAIHYVDGLTVLGVDEADLLHDGIHPGPEAQPLIGKRFATALASVGVTSERLGAGRSTS
ncbi:SGNH/GDSL hydrolase family protein [Kribbella sp. NPDC055071]